MKVCILNQPWNKAVPPVQEGSIAIWTYEVARRIARSVPASVISRRLPERRYSREHEGVIYHRISTAPDPHGRLLRLASRLRISTDDTWFDFAHGGYYRAFSERAARRIARDGCEVIHVHNLAQFVPVLRRRCPSARILLHMHCEWLTQLPEETVRARIEAVDQIVGCSDYISGQVLRRFPGLDLRVATLYNGVATEVFAPRSQTGGAKESGPILLFVGRISPEKGLHDLIDAFAVVRREFPSATLEIVGPESETPERFLVDISDDPRIRGLQRFYGSSYEEQLRARAARLGLEGVHFRGPIPHDRLPDIYRRATIVVNPSLSESFGMSLIEANASGVPVVACRAGGMSEAVEHGQTGLLVEPGDANALAGAILELLTDGSLRSRMGDAGVRRAREQFSWDRIAAKTLENYRQLYEGEVTRG